MEIVVSPLKLICKIFRALLTVCNSKVNVTITIYELNEEGK